MAKAARRSSTPSNVFQQTMFDIPAISVDKAESSSKNKAVITTFKADYTILGLNAVYEGRSDVYKDFSEYISSLKNY